MSNKSVFKKGAKTIYSSIYNLWSDKKDTSSSDLDYMSDEDLYNDMRNYGYDKWVNESNKYEHIRLIHKSKRLTNKLIKKGVLEEEYINGKYVCDLAMIFINKHD